MRVLRVFPGRDPAGRVLPETSGAAGQRVHERYATQGLHSKEPNVHAAKAYALQCAAIKRVDLAFLSCFCILGESQAS